MSIRRLRTLVAVASEGSFAAAADAVNVTHAAVSQQMKALEAELNVVLFDRSTRSPTLNQVGLMLVTRARDIVFAYDTMVGSVLGTDGLMGEIAIGALPTCMTNLVPRAIGALKARYPALRIRVVPGLSAELQPQVDRSVLDAAIVSEPMQLPAALRWEPFAQEPLVLLAAAGETGDDPIELLRTRPYIRFNRHAWVGRLIDEWLLERKLVVNEAMELDTLESIAAMVYNGLGVSIVPDPCLAPPQSLAQRRHALGPTARPRILGVIARRDSVKLPLVEALQAELRALVIKNC